jgi:hypothetical protein
LDEPVRLKLTGDAETDFTSHLRERIRSCTDATKHLFETNLVDWRRMYESRPLEKTRNFPFQNASNLVVPLIAIHCDTLLAQLMSALWKTRPLYAVKLYGRYTDVADLDEVRQAWEEFLQYCAYEPEELDLFRVEEEWLAEICRYGASTIKVANEKRFLDSFIASGDGTGGSPIRETIYDGPVPRKLAFDDFIVPTNYRCLEDCDIKIHRTRLTKYELMKRRYTGVYDPARVDAILTKPDRTTPDTVARQRDEDADIHTSHGYAEWDVHECWLEWRAPNQRYAPRVIAWYHLKTHSLLNAIYDFYPDQPFVMGRLLYRDDSIYGYGLCETLGNIQEEVSMIHNQRRDNQTVANTKVWRVNPLSKLHEGYSIYPSAMLPAEKDEIEPLQHGEVSTVSIDEERLSLELAEKRSGVSPPQQGFGAGTQGKRGVYSASGTMSLLQEGNRRTDLNISDVRYAHLRLGRILSRQYAFFGLDNRMLKMFGEQAKLITRAAEYVRDRTLGLAVVSSSASVNREIEKQNDMMLAQVLSRHYQMIANLIQGCTSSLAPPPLKDYMLKTIDAADRFMKGLLRSFDRDDVDALVPKVGDGKTTTELQQSPAMAGQPGQPGVLQFPTGMAGSGGGAAPKGVGPVAIVPGAGGAGGPGSAPGT